MEVSVSHLQPSIVKFKYDFDDEYSKLDTEIKTRSKRNSRQTSTSNGTVFSEQSLKIVYTEPFPISKALRADLIELCRKEAIPNFYHDFYNSLICDSDNHLTELQENDIDDDD
ncbi:unnamed protein product [Diatraea saccharalis]|uniref:Uncharacterized protein n=1 Tax=Diatraea saccharalis TaxID=40085 RepID=A0A9N9WDD1_9NEOP|nr:unnamed protein product [Diatraea saccharalis]